MSISSSSSSSIDSSSSTESSSSSKDSSSSSSNSSSSWAFSTDSSLSSSSSSSLGFSSSSSSSSSSWVYCCSQPFCLGVAAEHFSSWNVEMRSYAGGSCNLYLMFDVFGADPEPIQQIQLYKDPEHTQLVALGQGTAGIIVIEERGGSHIVGSVVWDGIKVVYPSASLLYCDLSSSSSSSSSSSLDSSSSDSSLVKSSLSSESNCCSDLYCYGSQASHFSGWNFSGMTKYNSSQCRLYVKLEYLFYEQQVRVYKDASYADVFLVASGQGATGVIQLDEKESSGLSGVVTWDGVPIAYPEVLFLSCVAFSTSSSTSLSSASSFSSSSSSSSATSLSLSSASSRSSQSSESRSSSSSSTSSSNSSSSKSSGSSSSTSTDSSSSIDSSSSTSESEGNVSSSSSSSYEPWNQTKPLILASAFANDSGTFNKFAQSVLVRREAYDIGKVYCYFYGPYGDISGCKFHLDLYTCNDDGTPLDLIKSSYIPDPLDLDNTTVNANGWYYFKLNVSGLVPSNQYLSFVLWQEGGDVNNYALYGYSNDSIPLGSKSFLSPDGVNWTQQDNVVRGIKVVGLFDAFDLENFRIVTSGANQEFIIPDVLDANFEGTKVSDSGGVVIDNPKLIASIVIDGSGSMGWNDRFGTRVDFARELIDRFQSSYPSDVLFDIVQFGSQILDMSSVGDSLGKVATINLDLSQPTRTTCIFDISTSSAIGKGDIYSVNGSSYEVLQDFAFDSSILITSGSLVPPASGTMSKSSGIGPDTIFYSRFSRSTISDGIVAFGFKNLIDGHTYNIGDVFLNSEQRNTTGSGDSEVLVNWMVFGNEGLPSISLQNNGPKGEKSMDIVASVDGVVRRPINSTDALWTAKIETNVNTGTQTLKVDSIADLPRNVDLVNGSFASMAHIATNASASDLSFEILPGSNYKIGNWATEKSVVQYSTFDRAIIPIELIAKLLVRDVDVEDENITFFVQTSTGLMIEWDFIPHKEWCINNLYWLGETAELQINAFDKNQVPFPDGTRIDFYVDAPPKEEEKQQEKVSFLVIDAAIGSTTVYVESISGYAQDDSINILDDNGNFQQLTIISVGSDDIGGFVNFIPPLNDAYLISDNAKIVQSAWGITNSYSKSDVLGSNLLPSSLSLIDITPITTQNTLNPSLRKPYDAPALLPSTTYDELNLDQERIRNKINDIPTIDGVASIRILPITEDHLSSKAEKDIDASRILKIDAMELFLSQYEQNSGDLANVAEASTNTTTTLTVSSGVDYIIETPKYLFGGSAETGMTSYATNLSETFIRGITIPGVANTEQGVDMLSKKYSVYPALSIYRDNGSLLAQQIIKPLEVIFVPPYYIRSNYVGTKVKYQCEVWDLELQPPFFAGYEEKKFNGVYASSENGFSIEYIVTNKDSFSTDTVNIKIYSSTSIDLDSVATSLNKGNTKITWQDINYIPPKKVVNVEGVEVIEQPLSEIDLWRTAVENNPISKIIADPENYHETRVRDMARGMVSAMTGISAYTDASNDWTWKAEELGLIAPKNSEDASATNPSLNAQYKKYNYSDPLEWTLATQYEEYEIELALVNGKATLNIPASDVPALLLIQASVSYGLDNRFEVIRSDLVFSSNPINVDLLSPPKIFAQGGDVTYEIGVNVTWNEDNIVDNTSVTFIPPDTYISPNVSVSDGGMARGSWLGPHEVVEMNYDEFKDIYYGVYESIAITISCLGFDRTIYRILEWEGQNANNTKEKESKEFYFKVDVDNSSCYSDGSSDSYSILKTEMYDDQNILYMGKGDEDVGNDIANRLMGFEQTGDTPRRLNVFRPADYYQIVRESERWVTPINTVKMGGLNLNIGHMPPPVDGEDPYSPKLPWRVPVTMSTLYRYTYNSLYLGKTGTGVTKFPFDVSDTGKVMISYPCLINKEPLGITVNIESKNGLVRNGLDSHKIVADVTWKGKPINGKFIVNEGSLDEVTIPYDFPKVNFIAGECLATNAAEKENDPPPDTRNVPGGCTKVGERAGISLDASGANVSLSRTDIFSESGDIHTHACSVDSDGNGETSETIVLGGNFSDHVHTIVNYVALAILEGGHTHNLRSVAIVNLMPVSDLYANIVVNGYVIYDPTDCGDPASEDYKGPYQNRMMYATYSSLAPQVPKKIKFDVQIVTNGYSLDSQSGIIDNTIPQKDSLGIRAEAVDKKNTAQAWTALDPTETIKGIDIVVTANILSWTYIDDNSYSPSFGQTITVPEKRVDDGTRVLFEVESYRETDETESNGSTQPLILSYDKVKKYMLVKVKATIYAEDLYASKTQYITVSSNLQWLPMARSVLSEPTNDPVYLNAALDDIEYIGASQIHDAIKESANRIIDFQVNNTDWKDSKKAIFLITDGDENTSENTITQAIQTVDFIDGKCMTPVIPVRLGYTYSSDEVLLRKYVVNTCGKDNYLIDADSQTINDVLDDIMVNGSISTNEGTYSQTIDLGADGLGISLAISDINLPIDTRMLFRIRHGLDNLTWTDWTEWYDVSFMFDFVQNMTSIARYFQYELRFYGNQSFQSPSLNTCAKLDYFNPQKFSIFFQPVSMDVTTDGYLSSIHISHKANIPATSRVAYGISNIDSNEINDYYGITRPLIASDRHAILLTRYNEKMLTKDYKTYFAVNGRWSSFATIAIYRINSIYPSGTLVDNSEYSSNSFNGSISFFNVQNKSDIYSFCLDYGTSFRMICNIENYGSAAATIDHISAMYNTSKRIPRDDAGNIIHTPINTRI